MQAQSSNFPHSKDGSYLSACLDIHQRAAMNSRAHTTEAKHAESKAAPGCETQSPRETRTLCYF